MHHRRVRGQRDPRTRMVLVEAWRQDACCLKMPNRRKTLKKAQNGGCHTGRCCFTAWKLLPATCHWCCELICTLGEEAGVHVENARKERRCWVVLQSRQQLGLHHR